MPPHGLHVRFEEATVQTTEFEPVLTGELDAAMRDPSSFSQVSIDPEVHPLVWQTGADYEPTPLHDWLLHAQELRGTDRPPRP